MKRNRSLLFSFIIILFCIMLFKMYHLDIKLFIMKHFTYNIQSNMYKLLDTIRIININENNIPFELLDKIYIFNSGDIKKLKSSKEKCKKILDELCNKINKLDCRRRNDFVLFDAINSKGGYFPSIHTDIEWNKIKNDGFNVWTLEYNNNDKKIGNMFIFYNKYLQQKYKNTGLFIRYKNDKIYIYKSCTQTSSEYIGLNIDKYLLETMTKEDFINNTRMYYLDFKEGDTIVFDKNIMHMSDYRDKSNKRKSFNFRIAIKDKKKNINFINNNNCGYLTSIDNNLNSIKNPDMYEYIK